MSGANMLSVWCVYICTFIHTKITDFYAFYVKCMEYMLKKMNMNKMYKHLYWMQNIYGSMVVTVLLVAIDFTIFGSMYSKWNKKQCKQRKGKWNAVHESVCALSNVAHTRIPHSCPAQCNFKQCTMKMHIQISHRKITWSILCHFETHKFWNRTQLFLCT